MKSLIVFMLVTFAATGRVFAQIPAEWQSAAQAVTADLERDTPLAAKPWTGAELTQGWHMARAWRKHNNGNVEIILAEYLTFVALCRQGCAGNTIEGKGYIAVAEQAKNLQGAERRGVRAGEERPCLAGGPARSDGRRGQERRHVEQGPRHGGSRFRHQHSMRSTGCSPRHGRRRPEQANTFARFAIFVQGKAWIGTRCLDITKVASVIGAPPRIEVCK